MFIENKTEWVNVGDVVNAWNWECGKFSNSKGENVILKGIMNSY